MISIGLYRHFKGDYYYVQSIVTDTMDERTKCVCYFNVMHPDYGLFTRPVYDFEALTYGGKLPNGDTTQFNIVDRKDNVTGQYRRFEKVKSLDNEVKNLSTETLINELRKRPDSPLQDLDIEGVSGSVFCRDYVVGDECYATEEYPRGVSTILGFTTESEARKYFHSHQHRKSTHVYKRVFIEVE